MIKNISILGIGQFGFAFARYLANIHKDNKEISIKAYDINSEIYSSVKYQREHPYFFKDTKLPEKVEVVESDKELLNNSDLLIIAIPFQKTRCILKNIKHHISKEIIILNIGKALEENTGNTFDKIVDEEYKDLNHKYTVVSLSGGMLASDFIEENNALGADMASKDIKIAENVKKVISSPHLRCYTTDDIVGVEYAGALKNVFAIGAGICCGLELSLSTQSLYIAKAAQEGLRICEKVGAKKDTFSMNSQCWGNDLYLCCMGNSRNKMFGRSIVKSNNVSKTIEDFKNKHLLAEGYKTTKVIATNPLFKELHLPIIRGIYKILFENRNPKEIIEEIINK